MSASLDNPPVGNTSSQMRAEPQKLSFFEKAGYSCADSAANFVFMTMVLFQLNFYTDVFGLSASAAAAILLWPRLWDAVFDPLMGAVDLDSMGRRHGPRLHHAERLEHGHDDRLCRNHEHDPDDAVFDEQHAV